MMNHLGKEREKKSVEEGPRHGMFTLTLRRKVILAVALYVLCMVIVSAIMGPVFLRIVNPATATFLVPYLIGGSVSPDGTELAVSTSCGIEIRALTDGHLVERLGENWSTVVEWSPDGSSIASVNGATLSIWRNTKAGWEPGLSIECRDLSLAWLPGSEKIITRSAGNLTIRGTVTGEAVVDLEPPQGSILCDTVAVSPTRTLVATAYAGDGRAFIAVWNTTSHRKVMARETSWEPTHGEQMSATAVSQMAWSPDGTTLSYLVARPSWDSAQKHTLELWKPSIDREAEAPTLVSVEGIHSYSWTTDSGTIAYIRNSSRILGTYDLEDGVLREVVIDENGDGNYNKVLGYTAEGRIAITLGQEQAIQLSDPTDLSPDLLLQDYGSEIREIASSFTGDSFVTLDKDGRVRLFDISSRTSERIFTLQPESLTTMGGIRYDGEMIYLYIPPKMAIWNLERNEFQAQWTTPTLEQEWSSPKLHAACISADLSPDNEKVALLYARRNTIDGPFTSVRAVETRSIDTGDRLAILWLNGSSTTTSPSPPQIKWSPSQDPKQEEMAFTDLDNTIYLWNPTGASLTTLGTQPTSVRGLAWHPAEPFLYTTGLNWTRVMEGEEPSMNYYRWDLKAHNFTAILEGQQDPSENRFLLTLSPDGNMLFNGHKIYNLENQKVVDRIESAKPSPAAWTKDGKHIITSTPRGEIEIYRIEHR